MADAGADVTTETIETRKKSGLGTLLTKILFWLISLGLLICAACTGIAAAFDHGQGRAVFWVLLTGGLLALALFFNPLVWSLLRRALHPAVTVVIGVVLGVGLTIGAMTTPYGAYLSAFDTPSMRSAANRGSIDARLDLAQRLLRDPEVPPAEALAQLQRGAADGHANAQALLTILTMGLEFDGRQVMERNDPSGCRLLEELETAPRFVGQEVDPDWRALATRESRYRGWRRANEPGEPLKCERASATPDENVFRFRDAPPVLVPARFDGITDLKAVTSCTIQPDGSLTSCVSKEEHPAGRGVGDWALSVSRNDKVHATDIYGWPSAGREIVITTTRE